LNASLQLLGVQCVRDGRALFEPLDVAAGAGQLLRVAGENGSGKTSLLRSICGLASGWRGRIVRCGRVSDRSATESDGIAPSDPDARESDPTARPCYLGHAAALCEAASPIENLTLSCALAGIEVDEAQAIDALASVGLQGRERTPVRTLSQGQHRRVALARLVFCRHRPLWVLDEPFNTLDDSACAWLQDAINAHAKRGGVTVMASHHERPWTVRQPEVSVTLHAVRSPWQAVHPMTSSRERVR